MKAKIPGSAPFTGHAKATPLQAKTFELLGLVPPV